MPAELAPRIARELSLSHDAVSRVVSLLDDGNTIPFIARYRKEATGGLDEVAIEAIEKRLASLRALEARRADVHRLITELGQMNAELASAIAGAETVQALDDLYAPYRPKRRTRAMLARERGLEPLANLILEQANGDRDMLAAPYIEPGGSVSSIDDAYAGARDIVAEIVSEDADVRAELRLLFSHQGELVCALAERSKDPDGTYAQYHEFRGNVAGLPPHRILAINRGERDGVLKVCVNIPEANAQSIVQRYYPPDHRSQFAHDLLAAVDDSVERLLRPALERERRGAFTEAAELHATSVFARNLRPLLLQPPLRGKSVIGIDPGYRTGCKVAVVDETGKLLETAVIYPHQPHLKRIEAKNVLKDLARKHNASIFAIGTGTASRESEELVAEVVAGMQGIASYAMVDEAGASVYSVSRTAREEFPDLDATERGAISIARRLQDPLAELVKVDPRAVGVGLYQHDIDQKALSGALDRVVESAVTFAGVDVNTASAELLHRVAGLNRKVAVAIVEHRTRNGKFRNKADLRAVSGLGPRAFEQAAGFLRIPDSVDVLDRTFIHPESYAAARRLIAELPIGPPGDDLPRRAAALAERIKNHADERSRLAALVGIGELTLVDLLDNLARPGLDPRAALPAPLLRTTAMSLDELQPGTVLQGTVRNVVDFGVFVDIGLKQAGLVHVSELSDRFVRSPLDVVHVGQVVTVRVLQVDAARGRIALSMRAMRT